MKVGHSARVSHSFLIIHKNTAKWQKYEKMQKNAKNICVYEKIAVPLHDFSRFVGSLELIARV